MRVGFIGMSGGVIIALLILLLFTLTSAPLKVFVVLLALSSFVTSIPYGAATAAVQEMIPAPMRATFSALFLFVVNIIGLGGGPLMVGFLNDKLFHDPNQVHLSLAITLVFAFGLSCLLLYSGLKAFIQSTENARLEMAE